MTAPAPTQSTFSPVIRPLPAERNEAAADVLAPCFDGDVAAARARLDAASAEEDTTLLAAWQDDEIVAVYVLEKVGFTNEVTALAVVASVRRRGVGRMCLHDALLRSGKRPLVIGVDEGTLPFAKAVGFKMVGRLKRPDGSVRYRMGWHAPMPQPDGSTVTC